MTTEAWPVPTQIIGQQFPNARDANTIGAGARTGPMPASPTRPPANQQPPRNHRPSQQHAANIWLSRAKWAVGPILMLWGFLPVVGSRQIWQADYGLILLGAVVLAAQWLYHERLRVVACRRCGSGAPVSAAAKLFLIALTALVSVAVVRPDYRDAADKLVGGAVEQAFTDDAAPAGQVTADPAQPKAGQG